MTDEQRVKEVWPDAKVICGPENCNGHQIVLPISGDSWGAEFGAWADAALRLPEAAVVGWTRASDDGGIAERPIYAEVPCGVTWGTGHVHFGEHCCPQLLNEHGSAHTCNQCDAELPLDAAIAPLHLPSKSEAISNPSTTPTKAEPAPQTFEEWWAKGIIVDDIYNSYRNACRLAWNAAKASSPDQKLLDEIITGGYLDRFPEEKKRVMSLRASSPAVAGGESETERWWFSEIRPIINAIGEMSVQEAMDAVEKMLKERR